MKRILLIILIFVAGHTSAQTRIWKLIGTSTGVQVYCDSVNIHQGQGYVVTCDLKVNIADTIIAGTPQYVTKYASLRIYPDSTGFAVDNVYDTFPATGNVWSESFSTDYFGITWPTLMAGIKVLRPANVLVHP